MLLDYAKIISMICSVVPNTYPTIRKRAKLVSQSKFLVLQMLDKAANKCTNFIHPAMFCIFLLGIFGTIVAHLFSTPEIHWCNNDAHN